MSQSKQPGYPLPSGELGEDELVCQLVYLPDRPEYWQALLAAIHYMSTWRAWERDSDKRGKDAAANWREAFELTIGCWRMTCLEQLQSDVHDILLLLQSNDPCCSDITTYGDTTIYITTIYPESGDPPDYYGETAVSDWDDWKEHVCFNAHLWVDELKKQANSLETVLDVGGLSVGLVAFGLAAIALFVVGGFISGPVVIAVTAGILAGYTSNLFSTAADDIETARDAIVCALLQGTSLAAAVEDALGSGVAWDIFYSHIDYDSAQAIIYEGGDGSIYLDPTTKDDCLECGYKGEFQYIADFEDETWQGFTESGASFGSDQGRDPSWGFFLLYNTGWARHSHNTLRFQLDEHVGQVGDSITIYSISFWYECLQSTEIRPWLEITADPPGGGNFYAPNSKDVWSQAVHTFNPPIVLTKNGMRRLEFKVVDGSIGFIRFDDFVIDCDVYTAP